MFTKEQESVQGLELAEGLSHVKCPVLSVKSDEEFVWGIAHEHPQVGLVEIVEESAFLHCES